MQGWVIIPMYLTECCFHCVVALPEGQNMALCVYYDIWDIWSVFSFVKK